MYKRDPHAQASICVFHIEPYRGLVRWPLATHRERYIIIRHKSSLREELDTPLRIRVLYGRV